MTLIADVFLNLRTPKTIYCNIFRCNYLRNKKVFLNFFFFCIFEIYIQFWTFTKRRWSSLLIYFSTCRLWKTWLDKCLKSPVSEDTLTSNMVNGLKHCWIWTTEPLPYSLITVKAIQLEKISLSDMQNLRAVC